MNIDESNRFNSYHLNWKKNQQDGFDFFDTSRFLLINVRGRFESNSIWAHCLFGHRLVDLFIIDARHVAIFDLKLVNAADRISNCNKMNRMDTYASHLHRAIMWWLRKVASFRFGFVSSCRSQWMNHPHDSLAAMVKVAYSFYLRKEKRQRADDSVSVGKNGSGNRKSEGKRNWKLFVEVDSPPTHSIAFELPNGPRWKKRCRRRYSSTSRVSLIWFYSLDLDALWIMFQPFMAWHSKQPLPLILISYYVPSILSLSFRAVCWMMYACLTDSYNRRHKGRIISSDIEE